MPVLLQYVTEPNDTTRFAAIASSIRSFRDRLAQHRPEANRSGSLAHVNCDSSAEQSVISAFAALHFSLCGCTPLVSIHRWHFRGWVSVVLWAGQVSDAQLRIWRAGGELDELQSVRGLSSLQGETEKVQQRCTGCIQFLRALESKIDFAVVNRGGRCGGFICIKYAKSLKSIDPSFRFFASDFFRVYVMLSAVRDSMSMTNGSPGKRCQNSEAGWNNDRAVI
jgi:hypothetical protein